jgi:response regulator RpfG family c-di-GMP phosphodiesterase
VLSHSNHSVSGTILVADDQLSNRELLSELLTTQGFKIITAADGAEALDQLSRVPTDLVLLDVMMPQLSGFEVCEKIKANPDTYLIPVILVTGLSDPYTHGHCERLAEYSASLGEHLGLLEDQIIALRRAGVVHDIGKIAIPDSIILKPSSLTPDEWKLMQQHPVIGERICAPLRSFRSVLPIIRHHHEKFDGSGYPDGLAGEAIGTASQRR